MSKKNAKSRARKTSNPAEATSRAPGREAPIQEALVQDQVEERGGGVASGAQAAEPPAQKPGRVLLWLWGIPLLIIMLALVVKSMS